MEQLSLFSQEINLSSPLASRLRPQTLDDYIGQEHLIGKGKVLRQMLDTVFISEICENSPETQTPSVPLSRG